MSRPLWDEYFLDMCDFVAKRGTCPRKQVGAVVAKNNEMVSTGYNGSLTGLPHCEDVGCDMEDSHCVQTVHAETNSIAQIINDKARGKEFTKGCVLYCNTRPCWKCFQTIFMFSHIKEIVYKGDYRSDDRIERAIKLIPDFIFRKVDT